MLLLCAVCGLALGLPALGYASVPAAELADTTARFELRSGARFNLHHLLLDWAAADSGRWPSYALQLRERERWRADLDANEQRAWAAAVTAYAVTVGRNLVTDQGLLSLRDWAAGARTREAIPDRDRPLADALDAVLPIYRRHWWPQHDASNQAWIDAVAPTLRRVEEGIIARMEAAYGGTWPRGRIPVDVVVYASAVGAYSAAGRLTISSQTRGLEMPYAIEMIFHEASHTDSMERALRAAIGDAFRAMGRSEPERFWHDVIFYTSGEITRLVLAREGHPGYEHYGSLGVYRRAARWAGELPLLEKYWKPFLESGSNSTPARRAALERLAKDFPPGR